MSSVLFEISYLFQHSSISFYLAVFILGLLVGSFLNVVIYRLPVMMKRQYQIDCHEFLELPEVEPLPKFNLLTPASTCPCCGHKIKPWENLPVLSWLYLRGRCSGCQEPISFRYPMVEIISGILSVGIAVGFGFSIQTVCLLLLTWCLITLAFIDFDEMMLPDEITLPLMWLGLLINLNGTFIPLEQALIGAVGGYMGLWSVFWLFKLLTDKDGLGFGDLKLLAVFGAWFGWKVLPGILYGACVLALVIYTINTFVNGKQKAARIPFGPYLVVASWGSIFYGQGFSSWLWSNFFFL